MVVSRHLYIDSWRKQAADIEDSLDKKIRAGDSILEVWMSSKPSDQAILHLRQRYQNAGWSDLKMEDFEDDDSRDYRYRVVLIAE